eukprot:CAMPEP_0119324266 /NCGR_PEP_ID=MMETSP1333-20130426/62734_1 /TAXON_ID=418940 /ORGANISM="Scyphosphaera apsteinii, Strain RCC1455" /LENGTH=55 /DNA_ID=CAMNT_0007331935 /DNA_START=606 /DNA_END=770 /DNA_ORIENTATION=-
MPHPALSHATLLHHALQHPVLSPRALSDSVLSRAAASPPTICASGFHLCPRTPTL